MRKLLALIFLSTAFALSPIATAAAPAEMQIDDLRCELAVDPLGIDSVAPQLSWILRSPARGQRQTAYQVLASSTEAGLNATRADLWDSGKVASDRTTGLKCLLLRKVGKANLEHFEDLRRTLFTSLPHEFAAHRGTLTFANESRIIAGHFQSEKDIDAYLGLEYDVIGIEEATTLTWRKYEQIRTCNRSSRRFADGRHWRPRIYSTTNPGGIGHAWYKRRFIDPYFAAPSTINHQRSTPPTPCGAANKLSTLNSQLSTVFIPARVADNPFANPEYKNVLENLTGWQRRAWLEGDWDIAAGQFFTTFRRDIHIVSDPPPSRDSGSMPLNSQLSPAQQPSNSQLSSLNSQLVGNYFDESRAREWFASLDYGFTHYTVVLLGCTDSDGNTFIVDEHAERLWLPERHAAAIRAMLVRHNIAPRALVVPPLAQSMQLQKVTG